MVQQNSKYFLKVLSRAKLQKRNLKSFRYAKERTLQFQSNEK